MINLLIIGLLTIAVFLLIRYFYRKSSSDLSGNFLDPGQIAKRGENLDKILELAKQKPKITGEEVRKYLGVSKEAALRYLEYLVNLDKLVRVAERGQEPYYQRPASAI